MFHFLFQISLLQNYAALVVATFQGDDILLSQITSQQRSDQYAIELARRDFAYGRLPQTSIIRTNRLFTADRSIVQSVLGQVTAIKQRQVQQSIIALIES